jgi:alkyl hydroperoxide reductase subunit F
MLYDLAIIGGGPAGVSAGVYASRKRLKTVFLTYDFGGQSIVSDGIENWIGTIKIAGADLAKNLEGHLRAYAGDILDIKTGERVEKIEKKEENFLIKTGKNEYEAKTVLITTGSSRRKLEIPGAKEFENKGITYCATCDGPLFADMDVAVIGGGNAAFESAAQLLAYAKSVVLLHRSEEFRADPVTVKKVLSNPKMHAVLNAELLEIKGDQFVNKLIYKNKETGEKVELPVQGVFVEIGSLPVTSFVKDFVKLDQWNHVVVDPRTQQTSVKGIWAAGDCTDGLYHQNNIAAGDAVKALEDIYTHIHAK